MPSLWGEQDLPLEGAGHRTARPEVWRVSEAVFGDSRDDLWGLACAAHVLASGHSPHERVQERDQCPSAPSDAGDHLQERVVHGAPGTIRDDGAVCNWQTYWDCRMLGIHRPRPSRSGASR